MTTAFRCSLAAAERGENLAGTASQADRFVLIEYPTPWPKKAVEVFDAGLRAALDEAVATAKAKVLLVRRPGQRTASLRRWAVVDARARRATWGAWESSTDLAGLAGVVTAPPTDSWSSEPIVLVCTHARHDACCGVAGRPVATALAEAHGDLVWEASHVGGHRFAANVVLPLDGTYYGRIEASEAADVIERHLDSNVSADHLRGFSWMPPAAQAVAVEVHRRWGPAGADDITAASAVRNGDDRWLVELTGADALPATVTAVVERHVGPEARLSCQADPTPTESFVIATLDADGE